MAKRNLTQEEANSLHRELIEKAARDARKEADDLARQIKDLQARHARAEADARRLTQLVVKTWGMGKK
jgi:hypothetical protein